MRALPAVVLVLLCLAASAAELRVQVLDPSSAAVAGARVTLFRNADDRPAATQVTSAEGLSIFRKLAEGDYRLQVLAPGFAAGTAAASAPGTLKLTLQVAGPTETVVVAATRVPVPGEQAGAPVASLARSELELLQPVAVNDALRLLPGAVVNTAGRRGGQGSLFVRGGESRYNKVIVDGVPVNDPGGTFDFGVLPLDQVERLEFVRGAGSVLYGSDAMTSVVQLWSATGRTRVPELRFGADGGSFSTARGYASLAGARGRLDYNLWAEQDSTEGRDPNDDYWNAAQGGNLGVALAPGAWLRLRVRHSNNRSGVQGAWEFNGARLAEPDRDQSARQNNFLASLEFALAAPAGWQHRFTAYEYNHRRRNADLEADRGCDPVAFDFTDCFFDARASINRAGLDYQADWTPRSWLRSTLGYEFEVENGRFHSQFETLDFVEMKSFIGVSNTRGLRRNHALYWQQMVNRGRLSLVGGLRFAHNESFGNRLVPRVAASVLVLRGGETLSGTRLRAAVGTGIKAPRFEESFGDTGTFPVSPNPDLKPEEALAWEAGFEQQFARGRHSFSATYFQNRFRDQIAFDATNFPGAYFNIARSFAHGAEVELHSRLARSLRFDAAYIHLSSQVLENPSAFDPVFAAGAPLLRRPKHSGMARLSYVGRRWGGNLGMSAVGRRSDSDFLGFDIRHAAGYARVDLGGWYVFHPRVTAYANVENALDKRYNEVVGYPALGINVRAGMRFRLGGE